MILALATASVYLIAAMAGAWALQRGTGNSGWIDTIWSFSVGAASLIGLMIMNGPEQRRWLLIALVMLWSARLGSHILKRTTESSDDPRYAKLIEEWGDAAPMRLFWFLQVQALSGAVLVVAILLAASGEVAISALATVCFALLAVLSIVGEAIADAQLAAFKRSGIKHGICDKGFWARSRHPNYFFEWLFWVSIAGLAVSGSTNWISIFALAAPLMMYLLLRYASGIPHVEAHMRCTRPEAFAAYCQRVPEFFPKIF